jgi:hypothetical protein
MDMNSGTGKGRRASVAIRRCCRISRPLDGAPSSVSEHLTHSGQGLLMVTEKTG